MMIIIGEESLVCDFYISFNDFVLKFCSWMLNLELKTGGAKAEGKESAFVQIGWIFGPVDTNQSQLSPMLSIKCFLIISAHKANSHLLTHLIFFVGSSHLAFARYYLLSLTLMLLNTCTSFSSLQRPSININWLNFSQ